MEIVPFCARKTAQKGPETLICNILKFNFFNWRIVYFFWIMVFHLQHKENKLEATHELVVNN